MRNFKRHPGALVSTAALVAVSMAMLGACSSGEESGGGSAADDTYTWWDPYPQHDASSDWDARVQACGEEAGVTIDRTAYDTTTMTNQALLSSQAGTSPDVILIDNQALSTLSATAS